MKLFKFLIFAFAISFANSNYAQDCEMYFPQKEGTIATRKNFDKKDKLTQTQKQKIVSKTTTGSVTTIAYETQTFDNKNKLEFTVQSEVRCENGVFYFDMKGMMDPKSMQNYKESEVKITASDLEMPSNPQVGQTLKDGNFTVTMANPNPMFNMDMIVKVYNRKVEAIEDITTEAGTFSCVKITYDVEIKSIFTMKTKATEWISKNVGSVKQESYDSNGKLLGYSVLSSIQ